MKMNKWKIAWIVSFVMLGAEVDSIFWQVLLTGTSIGLLYLSTIKLEERHSLKSANLEGYASKEMNIKHYSTKEKQI